MNENRNVLRAGETGFGILVENDAGHLIPATSTIIKENFNIKENEPLIVDCILQKWGVENKNGRIYPKEVLIPQVEAYLNLVRQNGALSENDHPNSSVVSLNNVSHIIKDMWWKDNVLFGRLEIITSPAYMKSGIVSMAGDKIAEYLRRNIKLGISSRGVGSLKTINGKNYVQDDFELICFDLVASPSTPGAYLFQANSNLKESFEPELNIKQNKLNIVLNDFLGKN
jgi:hypothetical protein